MLVRGLIESMTTGPSTGTVNLPGPWGYALRGKRSHAGQKPLAWQKIAATTEGLIERWKNTLTAGQRNQWNMEASRYAVRNKHGRTKFLNGWQLFMRDNHARLTAGFAARNVPGTSQPPPPFSIIDLVAVAPPVYQVTFNPTDPWISDPNAMCVLIDRGLLDTTKRYRNRRGVFIGAIQGVTGPKPPILSLIIRPFTAQPQSQFLIDGYSITRT